jgi:hypothetical protein
MLIPQAAFKCFTTDCIKFWLPKRKLTSAAELYTVFLSADKNSRGIAKLSVNKVN